MVEVFFEGGDPEVIADLFFAWTASGSSHGPHPSLKVCVEHLIHLHHLQHFPHAIGLIGHGEFK